MNSSPALPARRHSWKNLPEQDSRIVDRIITWYRDHGRDFAWRRTRDPWLVVCAELMLQRTRASQVEPVFERFSATYSGPADVIEKGVEAVVELFGQLGLLWRADYFFRMQQTLIDDHGGEVPEDAEALLALPGVGHYASAAVRVFAFGVSETVVDSNVLRVAGRYFGVSFPDHARRSPRILRWLSELAPQDAEEVREFNWGLIDFAAGVCRPQEPQCESCCLREYCWFASQKNAG